MRSSVLLVDDDPALLQALPDMLLTRFPSVRIDTSVSPFLALDALRSASYDALISDLRMPGMTGVALLHEVNRLKPDLPVLLITGTGNHTLASQVLDAGAFDFLLKPFDRDEIAQSVHTALQWHRLKQKLVHHQAQLQRMTARHLLQQSEYYARDRSTFARIKSEQSRGLLEESHRTVERSFERMAASMDRMQRRLHLCERMIEQQESRVAQLRHDARRRALTRFFSHLLP